MSEENTQQNAASAQPLTAADVQRMINEGVTAALKPVTETLGKLSANVGQSGAPNNPAEVAL